MVHGAVGGSRISLLRRLRGRLLLASSATNTHARTGERRAARPETGNARGEAGRAVGRGTGESRTGRLSRRAAPRSYGRRLPTSHLATGTHKQISDNGHAPWPTVFSTAATASPTRPGRGTAAFDRDRRQATRDFHGNVAGGAYVLAVNRKYDDCHGGPSPTPQELTRAGHHRIIARGTGPLGGFRPPGDLAMPKKKLCSLFGDEMSHEPFAFLRLNAPAGPFSSRRGCARSPWPRAPLPHFRRWKNRAITKANSLVNSFLEILPCFTTSCVMNTTDIM